MDPNIEEQKLLRPENIFLHFPPNFTPTTSTRIGKSFILQMPKKTMTNYYDQPIR